MQSGSHEFLAQDRVIWGKPAAQAVLEEADRRGAKRVFVVTSKTLNRTTDAVSTVVRALGDQHVGTFDECVEHTPRASVIAAAQAAREVSPDLVVTIGGGTAIDTVKVMLIALAQDVRTVDGLSEWYLRLNPDGSRRVPNVGTLPCRQIVVSTTLGAAEFSDLGGCTDPARQSKDAYTGKYIGAASVILDPAITVHTPQWLWLSTAIRGIDHAVEGLCSVAASPLIDATSLQALHLFGQALPVLQARPDDLEARLKCLQAAWMAGFGILRVPYGASHGIGHSLGAVTGISHGYTSCIMLPHVMRFNLPKTAAQQARIAQAMGASDGDAAGAVARLVASLGLPTRLRDQGVRRDQFEAIAAGAMPNMWVRSNPRPIEGPQDVIALLEAAY
jgi:alcohol dehydrogenase class IV